MRRSPSPAALGAVFAALAGPRATRDCPAIDELRQDLHDGAVATGEPTAEAEEPRGEMEEGEDPEAPVAPAVQQACPASFGNSDIFGWSSLAAP